LISLIPLHAGITIACLVVTVTIAVLLVILVYKKERKWQHYAAANSGARKGKVHSTHLLNRIT